MRGCRRQSNDQCALHTHAHAYWERRVCVGVCVEGEMVVRSKTSTNEDICTRDIVLSPVVSRFSKWIFRVCKTVNETIDWNRSHIIARTLLKCTCLFVCLVIRENETRRQIAEFTDSIFYIHLFLLGAAEFSPSATPYVYTTTNETSINDAFAWFTGVCDRHKSKVHFSTSKWMPNLCSIRFVWIVRVSVSESHAAQSRMWCDCVFWPSEMTDIRFDADYNGVPEHSKWNNWKWCLVFAFFSFWVLTIHINSQK